MFDLASTTFVARHEDGLFLGPAGTGKSHLAQAIGQMAIQQGYRVLYREAHKLLEDLADATLDGERKEKMELFSTVPLLLYPGRLVAQLLLFDVPGAASADKQSGTYMGPVYPEAPKFREPLQELKMPIGVQRTVLPIPRRPDRARCPECFAQVQPNTEHCVACGAELPSQS